MSRISLNNTLVLILVGMVLSSLCFSQQRANDFTKRVRSLDGRLNIMSSKRLSNSRINSISTERFSVNEWPNRYSSFGGKRYPMQTKKTWGSERVNTSVIDNEISSNQKYSPANFKRVSNTSVENRNPAAASIEFRDAVYAELDKRVDDMMNNVNNMSLRDINRFQFRKDRPSEPGFPVQKAGAENLPMSSLEQKLGSSSVRGVIPSGKGNSGDVKASYWMGPRKMISSSTSGKVSPSPSSQSDSMRTSKNYRSAPRPVLGPKKIRVEKK
jgi:hypothetical protein